MASASPEVGDYILKSTIGVGSSGKVKLAEHKKTGQKVAIKFIKKSLIESKPDMAVKIRREISLMRLFDHPHLLKLIDVCESPKHLCIILEYASHGELFDFILDNGGLTIDYAMRFFRQIIYGLEFLHSHAICHRDMKLENILLDEFDDVKIADFGFARWMRTNIAETSCGSPHYAAPEVVCGLPYDGRAADIWSCGVIFYTLLTGHLPFEDKSVRELLSKIKSGRFDMPKIPVPLQELLTQMLCVDASKRITISQIKEHPGFRFHITQLYRFPSPIPVPSIQEPMDLATIDATTLNLLGQLGFGEENSITSELSSNSPNFVKSFAYLLLHKSALEQIQWSTEPKRQVEETEPLMREGEPFSVMSGNYHPDPYNRKKLPADPSASPEVYSAVEGAANKGELRQGPKEQLTKIAVPLESLIATIQTYLSEHAFTWFYPNEYLLITRSQNNCLEVIAETRRGEDGLNILEVRCSKGDEGEFHTLVEELRKVISSIPPIVKD